MIEALLVPVGEPCKCALCEESRFIDRLKGLLPQAEANELGDWYNALRESGECSDMEKAEIIETMEHLIESIKKI